MADEDGSPRPQLTDMYRQLAAGGVGLIITGHMYVHSSGKCHPEMTGIHNDALIPELAKLAKAVHSQGGKIAVQINHGGMQCDPAIVEEAVAPSVPGKSLSQRRVREMREDEIQALIDAYAQAARRAQEAGFDGVQLHAAHGYLINQFLSPLVNRRTDAWGGSFENRLQFLKEVAGAVRAQVGKEVSALHQVWHARWPARRVGPRKWRADHRPHGRHATGWHRGQWRYWRRRAHECSQGHSPPGRRSLFSAPGPESAQGYQAAARPGRRLAFAARHGWHPRRRACGFRLPVPAIDQRAGFSKPAAFRSQREIALYRLQQLLGRNQRGGHRLQMPA